MFVQRLKSRGFTIIEVMIVLAVAALILLVVLLAIPSLVRTRDNYRRKSDAVNLAAAVREYMSYHDGNFPAIGGCSYNVSCTEDCTDVDIDLYCPFLRYVNLGFYQIDQVEYIQSNLYVLPSGAGVFNNDNLNKITVATSWKCSADHLGFQLIVPPSKQSVAVIITVDTGGGQVDQCYDI